MKPGRRCHLPPARGAAGHAIEADAEEFTDRLLRCTGTPGQHGAMSASRLPGLAIAAACFSLAACGGSEWAAVEEVRAPSPESTQLLLVLDYCDAGQNPLIIDDVVEKPTEVRVSLSIAIPNDDRDDCVGTANVTLSSAIGDRTLVDERTGKRFTVEFGTPGAPPTTGTAAESSSVRGAAPRTGFGKWP